MAKQFDPKRTLKHIANPLLKAFFSNRGELEDVPWDDLPEHQIAPVFEAWQALGESSMTQVQVVLRDIHDLSDHRGLSVLIEEVQQQSPDQADAFMALDSTADKAMWVYLNIPGAFERAAMFARADALASGRCWYKRNSLPQEPIDVDHAMKSRLGTEVCGFYTATQMRGGHSKIEHYRRSCGSDYFFVYLDDYPDKHLVFEDGSGQLTVRSNRQAFQNVFVFNSSDGTMEVYARGGKKVYVPLQAAFCKAVFDQDIDPADPMRASYKLDHLLSPDTPLPTDARDLVQDARIIRMRLQPVGSGGYVEVRANPNGNRSDIYHKINRWLKAEQIPAESTTVLQATFKLTFRHDGPGRQPTLTFDVSVPHSCNLKSKPDDKREIGERCLKRWGVVDDAA